MLGNGTTAACGMKGVLSQEQAAPATRCIYMAFLPPEVMHVWPGVNRQDGDGGNMHQRGLLCVKAQVNFIHVHGLALRTLHVFLSLSLKNW
jgi:hypothetical protein